MSTSRFELPRLGPATSVRFPAIDRSRLANGLDVWTIPRPTVPLVTALLVLSRGTADDPADHHGLASLTGDLLDEGAGAFDAIGLAEAFAALGTQLEIDVGPDATAIACTALTHEWRRSLELLGDVVIRPRLAREDFTRVRDLRLSRLRQLSRSAGTMADRAYVLAVFGTHSYGHGALGTTASLDGIDVDDARNFWASMFSPQSATLIVGGDVTSGEATAAAERVFGAWQGPATPPPRAEGPAVTSDPRIMLVDRPGAPQSELRLGHIGPPRATGDYHSLVALNALLGGQFTSRINRRLREEKGVTYGARTSFDFRRVAGTFSCETSVQTDATATAIADVLAELDDVRREGAIAADELARGKASLTRGYVRNFETAGQLVRAAAQLATYALPDNVFDQFVPSVGAIEAGDVHRAAVQHVRPADATIVVVGDAAACRVSLETLGRPVMDATPEF